MADSECIFTFVCVGKSCNPFLEFDHTKPIAATRTLYVKLLISDFKKLQKLETNGHSL